MSAESARNSPSNPDSYPQARRPVGHAGRASATAERDPRSAAAAHRAGGRRCDLHTESRLTSVGAVRGSPRGNLSERGAQARLQRVRPYVALRQPYEVRAAPAGSWRSRRRLVPRSPAPRCVQRDEVGGDPGVQRGRPAERGPPRHRARPARPPDPAGTRHRRGRRQGQGNRVGEGREGRRPVGRNGSPASAVSTASTSPRRRTGASSAHHAARSRGRGTSVACPRASTRPPAASRSTSWSQPSARTARSSTSASASAPPAARIRRAARWQAGEGVTPDGGRHTAHLPTRVRAECRTPRAGKERVGQ